MKAALPWIALALVGFLACGPHYPHDPVVCITDSDCASGQKCVSEWTQPDAGTCLSTRKVCQKPCTGNGDCSYCGNFGICAVDVCDPTGPQTCGTFCGAGK